MAMPQSPFLEFLRLCLAGWGMFWFIKFGVYMVNDVRKPHVEQEGLSLIYTGLVFAVVVVVWGVMRLLGG
jgi:hypothetical protein